MDPNLILFLGVFLSETVKNLAKGSANSLHERVGEYLQPEFISLNLNAEDSAEEIHKKLAAKPEIKQTIFEKLDAKPDLLNEITEFMKKNQGRYINTKTYIENAGDITINQ